MPEFAAVKTVLLSMLPGLFWMVYLRSLSGGRVSPWWHWALALAGGWASTELTLFVSKTFQVDTLAQVPHVGSLLYFVLGVGVVEEAAKAVCALLVLKFPKFIEEPLLALQLCGAVALGFATTENVLYASIYGDKVLVGRFVFTTLAHILFVSVWGFGLGSQWNRDHESGQMIRRTPWLSFLGFLLLSGLAHGVFDWFLLTERPAFAILTLVVLWMGFRQATLGAFLRQEYQRELPFETQACPSCSVLTRAQGSFCSFCGSALVSLDEPELLEQ